MPHRSLLRDRGSAEGAVVGAVELFFDLVFVFAITQLSHALLHHLDIAGAVLTLVLFLSVWTVWIYTAWCTNWVSPNRMAVRLMLFVVMLLGLVMSAAIPQAFGARALAYGGAVAAIQSGRTLFMLLAMRGHSPGNYRNFQRILSWLLLAALFWLAGGFAPPEWRLPLWIIAVGLELAGPVAGFAVPGLGRSVTRDWDVSGDHMAERCGLFVIIALGEMIMMTGATFAELAWDFANTAAFAGATLGAIAMWWIYFNIGAERATHVIAHSHDPGALARLAYTFFHIPIVAGIVLSAVATELVVAHPHARGDAAVAATMLGSCAIYLAGNILFKRATAPRIALSHVAGMAALAGLGLVWRGLEAGQIGLLAACVMVAVAVWETLSLRGAREAQAAARPQRRAAEE